MHHWFIIEMHDVGQSIRAVAVDVTMVIKVNSHKSTMLNHPTIFFNETLIAHTSCQKHFGMHLDEKLNFNTHIKEKIAKANKGIGTVCKLAHVLPTESLVTIT